MESGGLLQVDITFCEAGSLEQPAATADTAYGTNKAAASVREQLKSFWQSLAPPRGSWPQ